MNNTLIQLVGPAALAPVSYTHLDVYKRQAVGIVYDYRILHRALNPLQPSVNPFYLPQRRSDGLHGKPQLQAYRRGGQRIIDIERAAQLKLHRRPGAARHPVVPNARQRNLGVHRLGLACPPGRIGHGWACLLYTSLPAGRIPVYHFPVHLPGNRLLAQQPVIRRHRGLAGHGGKLCQVAFLDSAVNRQLQHPHVYLRILAGDHGGLEAGRFARRGDIGPLVRRLYRKTLAQEMCIRDSIKAKKKRNLGLKAWQKASLQLVLAIALALYFTNHVAVSYTHLSMGIHGNKSTR